MQRKRSLLSRQQLVFQFSEPEQRQRKLPARPEGAVEPVPTVTFEVLAQKAREAAHRAEKDPVGDAARGIQLPRPQRGAEHDGEDAEPAVLCGRQFPFQRLHGSSVSVFLRERLRERVQPRGRQCDAGAFQQAHRPGVCAQLLRKAQYLSFHLFPPESIFRSHYTRNAARGQPFAERRGTFAFSVRKWYTFP